MLRETLAAHELDWCEKTMSVLREKQFEACERRLSASPSINLFSSDATNADAQELLEYSFYHNEPGNDGLISLDGLRQKVLDQLSLEALYLSQGEGALLERLLVAQGRIDSTNWDEIDAAEALASRLWCSFSTVDERWTLELAPELHEKLLKVFNDGAYLRARNRLFRFDATVHGLLYIAGFLHSDQPREFFLKDVIKRRDKLAVNLAYRYMKASFEYLDDVDRELVLLHPGLADPKRLVRLMGNSEEITLKLDEETLAGGMNGMLPAEKPLHDAMRAAVEGRTRPEWDAEGVAEDLRFLAKQGVSLQEMSDVMASMICVLPTQEMKTTLKNLYENIPHWIGMNANLQH